MIRYHPDPVQKRGAFTLVELLVAMSILSIILVALSLAMAQTQQLLTRTEDRAEKYREARFAFETVSRRLSGATVNAYWGYDDPEKPTEYAKQSELHFVSGRADQLLPDTDTISGHAVFFQAPFGYGGEDAGKLGGGEEFSNLPDALNCWGYFVEYNSDVDPKRLLRPEFLAEEKALAPERKRFRLMEYRLPTEKLPLFDLPFAGATELNTATSRDDLYSWFADEDERLIHSAPVAENILALFFGPEAPGDAATSLFSGTEIAPDYHFDSRLYQLEESNPLSQITRHQVPPVIEMTLIATTEISWSQFMERKGEGGANEVAGTISRLFRTATDFEKDIEELETYLTGQRIDFKIFKTTIGIRSGKWSTHIQ